MGNMFKNCNKMISGTFFGWAMWPMGYPLYNVLFCVTETDTNPYTWPDGIQTSKELGDGNDRSLGFDCVSGYR